MAEYEGKEINTTPTDSMAETAKRALEWREEYNRGGTEVGVARARDISNKRELSIQTVNRMSSYFARHGSNKAEQYDKKEADGGPTAGTIAWLLWGGTSGVNWAKKQSAALGAEESFTDDEKDRVRERLIRLRKPASDSFIEGYLTAK